MLLFCYPICYPMTTKIIFNRKKKYNVKNEALVEIEVYVSATNRKMRSTGVWIAPKFWDEQNKQVKKTHPDHELLNSKIQIQKQEIDSFLLNQRFNNGKLDITILENRNKGNTPLFFEWFEYTMNVSNTELSTGTQKIYKRALKYLREYSKDIPIENITVQYLEGFNKFLIDKKALAINTRASLFNKVKKVIGQAVKNDFISYSQNPFNRGFSVNEVEPDKHSLSITELKIIENLDMTLRPELNKTRDMFLFACYTGLRFGDLIQLSFENFEELPSGKIRLKYTPNKTRTQNNKRIEWIISDFWNGKIDLIVHKYLDKYKEFENAPMEKRLFFNYSNNAYNLYLKELQSFAKINQPLTSHLARHTCITLLINDFGLDITKAQMIAGHSKIEMTRKYLRVTERDLSEAAKKIDWDK